MRRKTPSNNKILSENKASEKSWTLSVTEVHRVRRVSLPLEGGIYVGNVHPRSFLISVKFKSYQFFCHLGECWAGHSNQDNYAKHGSADSGCIQDDYQACQENSRFCIGGRNRNMVYQIGKNHV